MKKEKFKNLDLDIYFETLDNGLEIIIVPMPKINNIYATFSTKYGSNKIEFVPLNEKKMIKVPLGIAHFLEHKLFEQEDKQDPFSFYSARGAEANANTNNEKTTYLFAGPQFFEDNLNYLLDYVQSPYLTDENVEKEKGIIIQEAKMYMDDPDTVLYEKLLFNAFNTHPIRYPIIGTLDSINNITKEELYTCYNTFYHPSNMCVVITGNVEAEKAIEIIKTNQINKDFKQAKKIEVKEYQEDNKVEKEEEVINLNVSIPKTAIGIKIKIDSKNLYKNLIYTTLFFDTNFGTTSLFTKEMIEKEIINSNLLLDFINTDNHMLFLIANDSKNPDEFIKQVKKQLKQKILNEDDFNRKKKTLISSLIYMSDNVYNLNELIMSDITRYGSFNFNRYEDIKNLSFKEYKKYINDLDISNITTCIVKK